MSTCSDSWFKSSGITVHKLEGTSFDVRHSWLMRNSLADVNWITSQRSTFIMRPSSETMTFRKRSRLIAVGKVLARRSMIPSRASCILILRSKERDWTLLDIWLWQREFLISRKSHLSLNQEAALGAGDHSRSLREVAKQVFRQID